eukprot:scaffold88633_cov17-Tisochrysis_lutea.AAC.1
MRSIGCLAGGWRTDILGSSCSLFALNFLIFAPAGHTLRPTAPACRAYYKLMNALFWSCEDARMGKLCGHKVIDTHLFWHVGCQPWGRPEGIS